MKEIGQVIKATIKKKVTNGFAIDVNDQEIVIPDEEMTGDVDLDQAIDVFLYENKSGKLTGTMKIPDVTKDQYGWAEVVQVLPPTGLFVDIGLADKDILVSSDHLPKVHRVWPKEGDVLFVSLELDHKKRLIAEPISEEEVIEDLTPAPPSVLHSQVTARVYKATKAGSAALTEEGYRGFIHPTERKQEPRLGQTVEARIIDVKEDGTINLSLRPLKQESRKQDADVIYDYLCENDGVMYLHDKSSPEEIQETFHISKAAFKRAVGKLMKENKVRQEEDRTVLVK